MTEPLTPEIVDRCAKVLRDRRPLEIRKPNLTATPEIYRLAREIDYDIEASFNIIRPITMRDLDATPLDDDILI